MAKNDEKTTRQKPFGSRNDASRVNLPTNYFDATDAYANQLENFIQFTSVISKKSVKFKAFLTAFEDQFKSDWNSEQVYGRNDPIQTFRNTTRTISIGWDCPAGDIGEARDNMKRAAGLIKMLYPSYTNAGSVSTISQAPLVEVKFRNLIKNLNGEALLVTISGINFSPDLEAGWFDFDQLEAGEPKADQLIPKLLKFSCDMTVLHKRTVGHIGSTWTSEHKNFPNLPDYLSEEGFSDEDFEAYQSLGDNGFVESNESKKDFWAALGEDTKAADAAAAAADAEYVAANEADKDFWKALGTPEQDMVSPTDKSNSIKSQATAKGLRVTENRNQRGIKRAGRQSNRGKNK